MPPIVATVRGSSAIEHPETRVVCCHGDHANYHTPEVGTALVTLFERYGYEVAVPSQACSGTPMCSNGMLEDADAAATTNVRVFRELVAGGL